MMESLFQIEFASAAAERLADRFFCSGKAVMAACASTVPAIVSGHEDPIG
jgi:hypothetical protein